ncbi:MAG: antibiotic biosynthesis monooxygenase [Alkalispirochaetaceae bacterium]
MIVRLVTVEVRPGHEEAFESATKQNHRSSLLEAGVLRFDVLKDADAPGRYYLYEVYRDEAATAAHKETDHYREWKREVAEYMAGDRSSLTCDVIAPMDEGQWRS